MPAIIPRRRGTKPIKALKLFFRPSVASRAFRNRYAKLRRASMLCATTAIAFPRSPISSRRLRIRPTCWRSTPPSRRHAPASRGVALPWSPTRCVNWLNERQNRPRKSAPCSPRCSAVPTRRSIPWLRLSGKLMPASKTLSAPEIQSKRSRKVQIPWSVRSKKFPRRCANKARRVPLFLSASSKSQK